MAESMEESTRREYEWRIAVPGDAFANGFPSREAASRVMERVRDGVSKSVWLERREVGPWERVEEATDER